MPIILAAVLAANLPLLVRTYDSAGVPARVIARAQQTAGITLAAVGIEPVWHPCHATGCVSKPKPHEIEIRIVKATARSEQGSLGFAAVDVAERAGTLATVYLDRIDALAGQAGVDRGELLGRAIAHEIGHLILGTVDHPRFGLMRALWKADELRRDMALDWIFSEDQGAEMRRRLAARTAAQPVAESVIVSARLSAEPEDRDAMFKRAQRFDPGTRVTVTVAGAAPAERYFVRLDAVELIVLKLDAPGLPKRQLLSMASDNPAWMVATSKMTYKDNNLRVGPDGVFVKDRKLADLAEVVEHIAREKVVALDRP
jgi:hypothetical protein